MHGGRIAPDFAQKRQHRVAHRRVERCGGVVIEINRARHRETMVGKASRLSPLQTGKKMEEGVTPCPTETQLSFRPRSGMLSPPHERQSKNLRDDKCRRCAGRRRGWRGHDWAEFL